MGAVGGDAARVGRATAGWIPLLVAAAMAAGLSGAAAQAPRATLAGVVRDSAGNPVPGAEVRFLGAEDLVARTNDSGGFRLGALPAGPGRFRFRRMGFQPAIVTLTLRSGQTDSLVLSLTINAVQLPGVLVEDEYEARSRRLLAGFWDRRARGFGNYITRTQIEKREAHEFVDIVRLTPGVSVQTRGGRKVLRFARGGFRNDCPPDYFVDGMRIDGANPDEFTPQDVEAIELYSGPATIPPMFAPKVNAITCGAVIIWTRIPG